MRNVLDKFLILLFSIILSATAYGQQIAVRGGFLQDSVKIGENITYWLTAEYPQSIDLILPDTLYDFTPWEFSGKQYFPSQLKNGQVFDSAVYTLQSYEIDEVQYLGLPAFVVKSKSDTTTIKAALDSIYFQTLIPAASDTLRLKTNLDYQDVDSIVNYPLIWIIAGAFLVIALIVFLVFGKRIRKMLKLRRLKKDYIRFSEELSTSIQTLKKDPNQKLAEHTLAAWKLFLEKMEKKPFSTLTTREIMAMEYTSELNGTLKSIDRCVYGGINDDNLYKSFQAIEDFTQHRYTVISDQIKNS
ncbi:hypothetical protein [Marinoscillum sp.]|uniref:hypothetical protein n=1 Tax=Marinoscillum sp. TaxID=2024838 RepID=UPI003BAAE97F